MSLNHQLNPPIEACPQLLDALLSAQSLVDYLSPARIRVNQGGPLNLPIRNLAPLLDSVSESCSHHLDHKHLSSHRELSSHFEGTSTHSSALYRESYSHYPHYIDLPFQADKFRDPLAFQEKKESIEFNKTSSINKLKSTIAPLM
jgi:hypothetical protein